MKEKKSLSDKITDIFRFRDDLKEWYNFMDRDETLCEIKSKLYGLRPPGIGGKIEIDGEPYYDFSSLQVLANANETELRKCKLSRQKSKYIKELASEVAKGYDLEKIREMNNEEAIEELMKFKGIGRWTAELILITTLGRMDLCIPDDLGARKSVSYFYFDGKLQSGDAVIKFTERWDKFKGWIIYYLICAYNMETKKEM